MTRVVKVAGIVGSIFGAFLLWLYVIGYDSSQFQKTFDGVQVVIEGVDELSKTKGFTLQNEEKASYITVVARGKRSVLNELKADDFRAVVDISQTTFAGKQSYNIVVESPNGVEIDSQSSTKWELVVDEFVKRNEPLTVQVDTGNDRPVMADGVFDFDATVNPLTIEIEGPKSMIDDIEGAYVKFFLEDKILSNNLNGWGPIELRDKDGNVINNPYIKLRENTAYVEIKVIKKKTVPVEIVFKGDIELNPVQSANPSVQTVTVIGTPSELDKFNKYVIEIDETTISGSCELTFPVVLPEKLKLDTEASPDKITVAVDLREGMSSKRYNISSRDIVVNNLPEGVSCRVKNDVVVTVVGLEESLENINRKLITVCIDYDLSAVVSNGDGTYTAEAIISLGAEYPGVYIKKETHKVDFKL